MMRLIPIVSAALALSMSEPSLAQEWIEFASPDDRFTCNFPGEPNITETTYLSEYGADLPGACIQRHPRPEPLFRNGRRLQPGPTYTYRKS